MGATWPDCAARVCIRSGGRKHDRSAPDHRVGPPQGHQTEESEAKRITRDLHIPGAFERHPTRHPFGFTEEDLS
jgi:hypothetical protein